MAVEYVDKGNDDGTNIGQSDGKIGFYGLTTPIAKATLTTVLVAGGSIGACVAAVQEIQNALQNLGLITTV